MTGVFVASVAISVGIFVAIIVSVIIAVAVSAPVARVVFLSFVSGAHNLYMIFYMELLIIAVAMCSLGVLKAELYRVVW